MKKIIYSTIFIAGSFFIVKAQNTIPTTTCTGALKINDSLNVNKDITALGDITSKGEVVSTDTLRAKEDVIASKDVKVDGSVYVGDKLNVAGQSTFEQEIFLKKGLLFDNLKGLSFTPSLGNNSNTFHYGNKVLGIPEKCAAAPQVWANHQFGGMIQIFDADPVTGAYMPNSGLLNIQTWTGGSSIDASVGGIANGGGLLLNYFCGNNTFINTGVYGGKVSMGKNVEIGMPTENLNTALNINLQNSVSKAISIFNPSLNKDIFQIKSNGATYIGAEKVNVGPHTDAMLTVSGKVACKEVRVFNNGSGYWADFVFEKNYKLMPILEVEKFYLKNRHLPNIPTAKQIEENGNDLAKTDALLLQKIEELTLYIVQQQKEIEDLKKKIIVK